MSELKTLKDIEKEIVFSNGKPIIDEAMKTGASSMAFFVKAEAVKWVKQYQKEKSKMTQEEMAYWCYIGRIHALKEFHNITEEDLQ